ncbi:single-stranded-DNA-specific exonuclease RecJ [Vibrio sp. V27_P1S3P104]|uniref:single-stranded-DNA-specific exonuclease RecJ n=1 Tax=unclassified Vibrio TaxID=2614977 RepID=UPI001372B9EB|nr:MULTISPECIES: single-stranded-DNA-specific exonuclease RecJ [unclassified Vibrio]NAW69012.1 single-stranded-DNA-specific exonuclease RecJ [Vibrio sp. V28_P6S34P95]NAX04267.1 single-stranded-DNA-specific exonuclease RecJ [Vibrio sp. V30_P3S12P165]NAX33564.1 single-stranded-DNA-specific exonuclease RecJ [Vibrio sp. V29_P1S30P107]NAX36097.1 single-stranded-DNA-specific exonuclease RecJ [Vibrio sp. V27_P1S3P104]NAX40728.1 single-stranded-DNA-specific exonuclease RecJ [Vibrio sp. V26_P1S5P106]
MIEIQRRPDPDLTQLPDSIPDLLKRIYLNRGITTINQLEKAAKALHSYRQLHGIELAVELLFNAIQQQRRIIIVGDFDADGATSCALSVLALRMLGCHNVDYLVPNRFEDGYGLSPEVVDQALALGAEMIMTVDNGVSSIEGVRYAKQHGLTVLVTDHHLPGQVLPEVDAMVNPNLQQCAFPSKALAGVGVAFYLMMALCVHMRQSGWFKQQGIAEPKLMELIDLVALGTVADVVPLDENNRILVHQGLQRIRAGKARPGIQALIEVAKRDPRRLMATDFGFALGPRINAAGRLDDMSFGVELLLSNNIHAARRMANELDALNQTRKAIEEGMKQEALAFCERLQFGEHGTLPAGLVLFQRDWHQGVIGILASRIKDKYHRPVIAFAEGGEGIIKGSCRSIPGLHMRDTLDKIDTQHPGLIIKFGGHAMAAGLTIAERQLEHFRQLFEQVVNEQLDAASLKGIVLSDGELKPEEFSMHTAETLRAGGPWGQAFPEPLFDGEFKVLHQKLVGEKHLKLMLEPLFKGHPTHIMIDGIAFNVDLRRWPDASVKTVHLAYKLDINEFRGNQSLQLLIDHIEAK